MKKIKFNRILLYSWLPTGSYHKIMAILIFLSFKFGEFGSFSCENSLYRLKSYFPGRNLMKLAHKKTLIPPLFIRWDASQVFIFRKKSFLLTHHHKKFDTWETSQNNSFYVRMEGLPSPISENCGKINIWDMGRCSWEPPWGTDWELEEHNEEPIENFRIVIGNV
jgi:hypothetical protein